MHKYHEERHTIMQIEPYVPGRAKAADGVATLHKLSSNETPFGPSPKAVSAYKAAANDLALYPDGSATALRITIARHYGIDANRIVCGNGSDDILHLLAQIFISDGDEAIYTQHGFLVYPIATRAAGGTPVMAREENFTANVDAILAKQSDRTRIVFLANPNNPTGTYLPLSEVKRLRNGLREDIVLVLDGAYAEYVREDDYEAGFELVATRHNVVITHTFSKIYGLAALRLGWCYAPAQIVDLLHRVRGPFNVNSAAMAAGVAAFEDQEPVERAVVHNKAELAVMSHELEARGLKTTHSVGNFHLVEFPQIAGRTAHEADLALQKAGIIVRRLDAYGLPTALRITIGSQEANRAVIKTLKAFMAGKA